MQIEEKKDAQRFHQSNFNKIQKMPTQDLDNHLN